MHLHKDTFHERINHKEETFLLFIRTKSAVSCLGICIIHITFVIITIASVFMAMALLFHTCTTNMAIMPRIHHHQYHLNHLRINVERQCYDASVHGRTTPSSKTFSLNIARNTYVIQP